MRSRAEQPQRLVAVVGRPTRRDRRVRGSGARHRARRCRRRRSARGSQLPTASPATSPTCADVTDSSRFGMAATAALASRRHGMPDCSVTVVLPCLNEAASLPGVLAAMPAGYQALSSSTTTAPTTPPRSPVATAPTWSPKRSRVTGRRCTPGSRRRRRRSWRSSTPTARWIPASCPPWSPSSTAAPTWRSGDAGPVPGLRWPWHARLGTAAVCWRLRTRYGLPVHDIAPMRVARRDALLALGVTDRRSGYPLELLVRAAAAGWPVVERDVRLRARAPAASRRSAARCAAVSMRHWTFGGRSRDYRVTVLVVAKAPVPGLAKTRLAATVGDRGRRRHRRGGAAGHPRRGGRDAGRGPRGRDDRRSGPGQPRRRDPGATGRLHRRRAARRRLRRRGWPTPRRRCGGGRSAPVLQIGMDTPQVTAELLADVREALLDARRRARHGPRRRLVGARGALDPAMADVPARRADVTVGHRAP